MNLCVSDGQVIINIQGIRNVTWGESQNIYAPNVGKPWFITVTYKGSHNIFYYRTKEEVCSIFNKIREAMDKAFTQTHEQHGESNWTSEKTAVPSFGIIIEPRL